MDPIVEVLPRFQWTPIGGVANFECIFETFDDQFIVHWFKNNEQLVDGPKVTIINNGTLLQVAALEQIDTGAYTCRVSYRNGAFGQSVASLLVQDDSVESFDTVEHHSHQEKLWIFHSNGITIYEGLCHRFFSSLIIELSNRRQKIIDELLVSIDLNSSLFK